MSVPWEPGSFEEFQRALEAKRCEVVLHKWTREWARRNGWKLWGFRFGSQFVRRVASNERDFWLAYHDGAFDLRLREPHDVWGRPR